MRVETQPDVAIIGGGPAGTTVGVLLKKYMPKLKVAIFERDAFPRDHVGESQLPHISVVLDEMGVWDKVERAGFPIKIGATYRWGKKDELWDFEFIDNAAFKTAPRPGKYEGQRRLTAFQVDRAIYDKILLDHAKSLGCDVYEEASVTKVSREGDKVSGLEVAISGSTYSIHAKHYVDASGHVGILRKAMGVEVDCPTTLQNIAIWDYWQNAEWAVSIGIDGTRIQVLSLGYGWIWFIPLGPTRTSLGLVIPAKYYKESGKRPAELYAEALANDKILQSLLKNATSENKLTTTKDWSFLAERLVGENWFLAGESAGFADPILSAGMTLAHRGGREIAYTILELERGNHEPEWLKERYDTSHRRHIGQHIRFADFWYSQNGLFSDLKDYTKEIAGDAGLDMTSDQAWQWFGTGGFIDHDSAGADVAGYAFYAAKGIAANMMEELPKYEIFGKTHFVLDVEGTEKTWGAETINGEIRRHRCYTRDGKTIPVHGACGWLFQQLKQERSAREIIEAAREYQKSPWLAPDQAYQFPRHVIELLEAMVLDGWVKARTQPGEEGWPDFNLDYSIFLHANQDVSTRLTDA